MVYLLGIQMAVLSGKGVWSYMRSVYLHFLFQVCCGLIFPLGIANSTGHLRLCWAPTYQGGRIFYCLWVLNKSLFLLLLSLYQVQKHCF